MASSITILVFISAGTFCLSTLPHIASTRSLVILVDQSLLTISEAINNRLINTSTSDQIITKSGIELNVLGTYDQPLSLINKDDPNDRSRDPEIRVLLDTQVRSQLKAARVVRLSPTSITAEAGVPLTRRLAAEAGMPYTGHLLTAEAGVP